jgi:glyoxylase-like metal-dependent hydrolase (beta-lactamase superfamily II)
VTDLEHLSAELNPGREMKVYKNLPAWNPDSLIDPSRVHDIHDGQKFSTSGTNGGGDDASFEVQAIHTPGHAKDHMVFQVTRSPDPSEIGVLFTADNVLGHGTAVFEDLQLYLQSLNLMKRRVVDAVAAQQQQQGTTQSGISETAKRAYPGHGQLIDDAVAKIDEYITHRRMREDEALNVLKYGTVKPPHSTVPVVHDSITRDWESEGENEGEGEGEGGAKELTAGKEWDSMEMVKVIYRHYPENLWEPAEKGLLMVLEKLRKDGRVVRVGEEGGRGRWRVSEKATL